MKTIDGPSIKKIGRILLVAVLSFIIIASCIAYYHYMTLESIHVVVGNVHTVEYGSENYDIKEFIEDVDGEIVSIKKDIDTSILGEQEVILEVKKDNVFKEVPVVIEVVDSVAPVISFKESTMSVTEGDSIDLFSNILSVNDEIDGDLSYQEENTTSRLKYYDIQYSGDLSTLGNHEIMVNAVDGSGNRTSKHFTLFVKERPIFYPITYGLPAFSMNNQLVSIAKSLVGMPYVSNTAGPYSFDCSGFVSYVYSLVGRNLGRSTYSQQYEGYGVAYSDIQPGDVIIWGYADGAPTHSSLYIGNGQMIHAANPDTGVIISNVDFWINGSGTHILTVRRFQ